MSTEEEVVIHIRLQSDLAAGLAKDRAELEAFKKSVEGSTAATDANSAATDGAVSSVDDLAESHGEASSVIKDGTKAKQADTKATQDADKGLKGFINTLNKFGTDYQTSMRKSQTASKDFFDTLNQLDKAANDGLKALVSTLGFANKAVGGLSLVAGGAKFALSAASVATKAWNGTLTILAASLGAVAVAASGALAAIQEVQAAQLSPFFGGNDTKSASFISKLYGDRNLSQFKKADILSTAQQLLSAGVPSNQIQTAETSVGGISLASGQSLKNITKDMIDIAKLGPLTKKNIQPFLGILPQLDAALKQHLGEKGVNFVQDVTGNKIKELQNVNAVLDKENNTLIGKAKGWARTIQSTLAGPGRQLVFSLKGPLDTLGASVNQFIGKHLPELIKGFSAFIPGAVHGSQTALEKLGKKFDEISPTLLAKFDKVRVEVDRFFDAIRSGWDKVKPLLEKLAKAWDAIFEFIRPIAHALADLVGGVLTEFSKKVTAGAKGLKDAGKSFADFITSLKPLLSDISDIIAKIVTTDTSVLGFFKALLVVIDPIAGAIRAIVDELSRLHLLGPLVQILVGGFLALKSVILGLKAISTVTAVVEAFTTALKGMSAAEVTATLTTEGASGGIAGVGGATVAGSLLGRLGLTSLGTIGSDLALPAIAGVGIKAGVDKVTSSHGGFWSKLGRGLVTAPGHEGAIGSIGGLFGPNGSGSGGPTQASVNAEISRSARAHAAAISANQSTAAGLGFANVSNPTQTLKNVAETQKTFSTSAAGAASIVKYFGLAGDSAKQLTKDLSHISAGGAQQVLLAAGLGSAKLAKQLTDASNASTTFHNALSNALTSGFDLPKAQATLQSDLQTLFDSTGQHLTLASRQSNLGNVVQDLVDTATIQFAGQKNSKKRNASITGYVTDQLQQLAKDPRLGPALQQTIKDTISRANKVSKLPENKIDVLADPGVLQGSIDAILNGRTYNANILATVNGAASGISTGGAGGHPGSSGHSSGAGHKSITHFNPNPPTSVPPTISDTRTSRFAQTLMTHSALDALIPGARSIASGLRNFGLGSLGSDHLSGYAFDLTGDNLVSYADNMNRTGGFAEFHGDGDNRHLHVVPPHGDTSSPWVGRGMGGSFQPIYNVHIYPQPSHSPHAIANMAMRAIDRRERDRMERS